MCSGYIVVFMYPPTPDEIHRAAEIIHKFRTSEWFSAEHMEINCLDVRGNWYRFADAHRHISVLTLELGLLVI